MHVWSFMCHPIFPWNAWSSDIGYDIVFVCLMLPLFWYLNSTNCEFVIIFWYQFFLTQSYVKSKHQVIQKKQSRISTLPTSVRCWKNPPSLHHSPDASPAPGTDSPSPWTNKKTGLRFKKRNQSKKKRWKVRKSCNWIWWKDPHFS